MAGENSPQPDGNGPLLNQRAAMIFLLGVLVGIGAGCLTLLATSPWPVAVTTGAAATAGAVLFFDRIIE
ncbi:hypothetical protein [Streptomyces sasae]|uniref:hypothetical protein n=1 Tax=Streptomyces sasae TaxID=1266772 RepID=UPI00292E9F8B|nr:hypothetical protein [Streptomyces sasae]